MLQATGSDREITFIKSIVVTKWSSSSLDQTSSLTGTTHDPSYQSSMPRTYPTSGTPIRRPMNNHPNFVNIFVYSPTNVFKNTLPCTTLNKERHHYKVDRNYLKRAPEKEACLNGMNVYVVYHCL